MAAVPSTPADGNIRTVLVPAIADETLAEVTVAEATAATAAHISCYLTPGGYAITVDQATITDERECDTVTRNAPGRKTYSLGITGIDNTNTTLSTTDNELADALTEGSHWYAIRRRGKAFDTEFTAGDVVSVTEFTVGAKAEVAAEANSVLRSTWNTFVVAHEPNAAIVAGV
jgi:hypothetical protein